METLEAAAAVIIGAGMVGSFMLGLLLGTSLGELEHDPTAPCPYCGSKTEEPDA